jgi:hypothetical protein
MLKQKHIDIIVLIAIIAFLYKTNRKVEKEEFADGSGDKRFDNSCDKDCASGLHCFDTQKKRFGRRCRKNLGQTCSKPWHCGNNLCKNGNCVTNDKNKTCKNDENLCGDGFTCFTENDHPNKDFKGKCYNNNRGHGKKCFNNKNACADGLVCFTENENPDKNFKGKCFPGNRRIGDECHGTPESCARNLNCKNGKCVKKEKKEIGGDCINDNECKNSPYTAVCNNQKCKLKKYKTCTNTNECISGLECDKNNPNAATSICIDPKLNNGESCRSHYQCISTICNNKTKKCEEKKKIKNKKYLYQTCNPKTDECRNSTCALTEYNLNKGDYTQKCTLASDVANGDVPFFSVEKGHQKYKVKKGTVRDGDRCVYGNNCASRNCLLFKWHDKKSPMVCKKSGVTQ